MMKPLLASYPNPVFLDCLLLPIFFFLQLLWSIVKA